MEINMIYAGLDSAYGFQSRVLKEIDKRTPFHKCILINKCQDGRDRYEGDKYLVLGYDMCEHNRYEDYYDFNDFLPLTKPLLEQLAPYESTVTHMLVRNTEHEVFTFDEAKRLYLMQLQFWNHMIETWHINFFIMNEVPHHAHHYLIYALCRVKNIRMQINISTTIPYHWLSGDDMFGQGERIYRRYLEIWERHEQVELSPDLEHIYQALQYANRGLDDNLVHGGITRKQHIAEQRAVFMKFVLAREYWKRSLKRIKNGVAVKVRTGKGDVLKRQLQRVRQDRYFVKRARLKMKSLRGNSYYESLAGNVVPGERFFIYFMHYQPEATTLPRAGVYEQQQLIVRLLARCLEGTGVRLYVKEHFVQPCRLKSFYDELSSIRNVRLITCDADSKELLCQSVAAATCTGTVIQEALMNLKPILIFGDGGFTKGPGLYQISGMEDCKSAVEEILAGKAETTLEQARAYLKAIELETVFMHPYIMELDEKDEQTLARNRESFVETAVRALEELKGRENGRQC